MNRSWIISAYLLSYTTLIVALNFTILFDPCIPSAQRLQSFAQSMLFLRSEEVNISELANALKEENLPAMEGFHNYQRKKCICSSAKKLENYGPKAQSALATLIEALMTAPGDYDNSEGGEWISPDECLLNAISSIESKQSGAIALRYLKNLTDNNPAGKIGSRGSGISTACSFIEKYPNMSDQDKLILADLADDPRYSDYHLKIFSTLDEISPEGFFEMNISKLAAFENRAKDLLMTGEFKTSYAERRELENAIAISALAVENILKTDGDPKRKKEAVERALRNFFSVMDHVMKNCGQGNPSSGNSPCDALIRTILWSRLPVALIESLATLGDEESVKIILPYLEKKERLWAISVALAGMGHKAAAAVPALLKIIESTPVPRNRNMDVAEGNNHSYLLHSFYGLAGVGTPDACKALEGFVKKPDFSFFACTALAKYPACNTIKIQMECDHRQKSTICNSA